MFENQERITKYNGAICRVICASSDQFKLVYYGWVKKDRCSSPVKIGDVVRSGLNTYTVVELPDSDDGLSVPYYSHFVGENKAGVKRNINYASGTSLLFDFATEEEGDNPELTTNPLFGEVKNFLDEVDYDYTPSVISKIVDDAYKAKTKLREKFRKSKYWNEELQAIIIPEFKFKTAPDYMEAKDHILRILDNTYTLSGDVYSLLKTVIPSRLYKNQVYLNDAEANILEKQVSDFRYHPGVKITKFFRSCFDNSGINNDTYSAYEREYAAFGDNCSPKEHGRLLVLSLNIMDFMTMSDGNSWDSCHSIRKRGCYHSGTLSYALDEVTAILYTLPEDTDISKGKLWENGKINRQLFMLSDDLMLESRLYPDHNKADLRKAHHDIVIKIWSEVTNKTFNPITGTNRQITQAYLKHIDSVGNHYHDYDYDYYNVNADVTPDIKDDFIITIGAEAPDIVKGVINHSHDCLTRDGDDECGDLPYEDVNGDIINDYDSVILYAGDVYHIDDCTWCDYEDIYVPSGEAIYIRGEYYSSEYVDENFVTCEHCGDYERREDMIECDGDYYCEECADQYLTYCEHCEEYHRNEDFTEVDGEWFCDSCLEDETSVCPHCGERRINSFLKDGVCLDCVSEKEMVVVSDNMSVTIKRVVDFKKFARAAARKEFTWRDGRPMNNANMYSIIERTFSTPGVDYIAFRINDGKVSYTPKAESLSIPESFGETVKFEDLSTVTVESEG